MNKQIEELAEQAGFENGHQDRYGNSLSDELGKFAELIVRECCQVFWTEECYTSDLAYLDYKEKTNKIKQHFGVKE